MGLSFKESKIALNKKISLLVADICQASRPVIFNAITPNTYFSQMFPNISFTLLK